MAELPLQNGSEFNSSEFTLQRVPDAPSTLKRELQTGRWQFSHGARSLLRRIHQEDGAAAVPFVLALPPFLMIVSVVVQYALMLTAYMVVNAASEAAARSAMVALPEGNTDVIARAARMVLANVSPKSGNIDPEGQAIATAFTDAGMTLTDSYAARYTFAMQGSTVTWDTAPNYLTSAGRTSWVQVDYQFQLTVPFVAKIFTGGTQGVGGVPGNYAKLSKRVQIFTTPSRKATASDVTGPTLPQ